jgi:hypothetical protein
VHLKRVIPCLDVDAGRVVKGTNFVDIRDAGDPVELAERYDREGADELIFLDITATSDKRETMVELARRTADEVFIPFTIGLSQALRGAGESNLSRHPPVGDGRPLCVRALDSVGSARAACNHTADRRERRRTKVFSATRL